MARDDSPDSDAAADDTGGESDSDAAGDGVGGESHGDSTADAREQGVDFGRLQGELTAHEYPATRDELVAEYGEYELDLPGGSETFGDVLGRLGEATGPDGTQQFDDAEAVRQAVFNMVGSDAVGREDYSDRGGSLRDEVDGGESDPGDSM